MFVVGCSFGYGYEWRDELPVWRRCRIFNYSNYDQRDDGLYEHVDTRYNTQAFRFRFHFCLLATQ